MVPLDGKGFRRWLDKYAAAWETRDPDAAAALFAETARYHETPFSDPLEGRDAIREYWRAAAAEAQRDVTVEVEPVALGRDHGVATFRASFTRVPDGADVTLDGALVARFLGEHCVEFREWWHIDDGRENVR